MPFFFIFPVWFLCVLAGIVTMFFKNMRRYGISIIVISTSATLFSFVLSTAILRLGATLGSVGQSPLIKWSVLIVYLISIPAGLFLGGIGAAALLRRVMPVSE